ncbi:hypothetical protein [Schlesneria sp.]|uniref:hypothetical protein n=1 Tax=Schlesneria sp. TaxID=2762018 RepID=UPI002EEB0227
MVKSIVGSFVPAVGYSCGSWFFVLPVLVSQVLLAQDHERLPLAGDLPQSVDAVGRTDQIDAPESGVLTTDEKKRKASIALAAVGGIAILGVGIIAATMVWARRLRRLARNVGPPQRTICDDFWFLKPAKPTVTESPIDDPDRNRRGDQRDD